MKVLILTITVLIVLVGFAGAGQGEVCYSASIPVTQNNPLTNVTIFTCDTLGAITIPGIYLAGWRVAHLSNIVVGSDPTNPLNSLTAWMILIEIP